jgi:hypothetical protein
MSALTSLIYLAVIHPLCLRLTACCSCPSQRRAQMLRLFVVDRVVLPFATAAV